MDEPELAEAPVISPVIIPTVHVNELGTEAVKLILVLDPLQIFLVGELVTAGVGVTVTKIL